MQHIIYYQQTDARRIIRHISQVGIDYSFALANPEDLSLFEAVPNFGTSSSFQNTCGTLNVVPPAEFKTMNIQRKYFWGRSNRHCLVWAAVLFSFSPSTVFGSEVYDEVLLQIKQNPNIPFSTLESKNRGKGWKFYLNLGNAMIDCKRYQDAEKAFKLSILELDSKLSNNTPLSIGMKYAKATQEPRQRLTDLYLIQASELEKQKQPFNKIDKIYKSAVSNTPENHKLWRNYSLFLHRFGRKNEANEAIKEYLKYKPISPVSHVSEHTN